MRVFQTCLFIVEIIFYLTLGLTLAINPKLFLGGEKYKRKETVKYVYVDSIHGRNLKKRRSITKGKVICFVIIMSITLCILKPYFLDLPQLITGKLNYVTAKVENIESYSKDPIEYVYLSGGYEVKFLLSSGVSKYEYYNIGYLTNTQRAIYCEEVDMVNGTRKEVGFPFEEILIFLAIIGIALISIFFSPYLKFRVLIPVYIISIPIYTYYAIQHSGGSGKWFSPRNEGFGLLIVCILILFILWVMYYFEKRKKKEIYITYTFAQLASGLLLLISISIVYNLL